MFDGEIHELDTRDFGNYRRIEFEKHKITIAADDLFLNRRDTTSRSDREMTVPMIFSKRENISNRINIVNSRIGRAFTRTGLDSIVPATFDESQVILSDYKKAYSTDSSFTIDEKYKKKKT